MMEKVMEKTNKLVNVPSKAQIRVDWQDYPENRTVETVNRVKTYFSEKYGVPKTSIKVNFIPILKNSAGKVIDISDGVIDNIMDTAYQRGLFREWLKLNEVVVDYDRLCRLDDKINEILINNEEEDIRYRRWGVKKLWLNNFLSFGNNNEVEYKGLNGLTVVNSIPANQGGKTIFTIDSLLFLFFGKTTKTEVNIEVFNTYSNGDSVLVGGHIEIDGDEYILERSLSRKLTKNGDYNVSTKLEFYRILSDGTQENLEGEQRRETDKLIADTIGTYDDFMLTIVATAKNLEDLMETKPTQRGRLLTKFIGLEVIEKKEDINKGLMSDFKSKMKSNLYNTKELELEIESCKNEISESRITNKENDNKLSEVLDKIKVAKDKKEDLLGKRYSIDDEIKKVNPDTLKKEIEDLTKKGVKLKEELDTVLGQIKEIPKFSYDEDVHEEYRTEEKSLLIEKNGIESDITNIEKLIKDLKEGEICPTCKRALDEVDHSSEIKDNEKLLKEKEKELKKIVTKIEKICDKLKKISDEKKNSDLYDKLGLTKDKTEIEITRMRVDYREKTSLLKDYERNSKFIDENRKLESKILGYNQLIETLEAEKDNIKTEMQNINNEITNKEEKITKNGELIIEINKEEEVLKIFEVYNRMIGKNGISKLVLSSVIPIINYELTRLLDEVCDFEIQLEINDKNEVDFLLIKNNVTKKLRTGSGLETTLASLALRSVLGRISTLPKPNIIVFDEVLGKVANINLDQVKIFFDKIKKMYEIIFLISHNPIVQDWADKIITVEKNNDISSLQIK
jgi:DNA repair exonuclease SbcCD ATPase subunit